MDARYTIMAHSKTSNGGQGEYPSRFILVHDKTKEEYFTAMQVMDSLHDDYFIRCHYFKNYDIATDSLYQRVFENNQSYRKGNVSHMPDGMRGIEWMEVDQ